MLHNNLTDSQSLSELVKVCYWTVLLSMSSLTANLISADLNQFKSVSDGQYATVTHYRRVYPHHVIPQKIFIKTHNRSVNILSVTLTDVL